MKQRVFLDLPVEMLEKLSMAVAKTGPRSLIRYWHATGTFCPRIYRRLLKTSFTDQWQVEEILSFGGPIYVKILKELDFDLTEPIISSVLNPFRRALLGTLYGKPLSQRCLPLGRVFPKVVCERDLLYLFEIEAVSFPIKVDDLSRLRNRGFWESLRSIADRMPNTAVVLNLMENQAYVSYALRLFLSRSSVRDVGLLRIFQESPSGGDVELVCAEAIQACSRDNVPLFLECEELIGRYVSYSLGLERDLLRKRNEFALPFKTCFRKVQWLPLTGNVEYRTESEFIDFLSPLEGPESITFDDMRKLHSLNFKNLFAFLVQRKVPGPYTRFFETFPDSGTWMSACMAILLDGPVHCCTLKVSRSTWEVAVRDPSGLCEDIRLATAHSQCPDCVISFKELFGAGTLH